MSKLFFATLFLIGTANPGRADALAPLNKTIASIQDQIVRGDFVGARAKLADLLKREPQSGVLYNLLGILEAQTGGYSSAEQNFATAIRLQPALTEAYLNLGRLYTVNADRDAKAVAKGIEVYRGVLRRDRRLVEPRYQLALLLEWQGSFSESLGVLDQLPEEERRTVRVLTLRAANLAGSSRLDDAKAVIQDLARLPDLSEEHVSAILAVLDRKGTGDLALPLLEKLVLRKVYTGPMPHRLAAMYEQMGQLAAARQCFEDLAKGEDGAVQPLLDLARVAYKQRDLEGALGYLAHARDLEPKNPKIHFFFGVVAMQLNVPIDAKKSLLKALELDPGDAYAQYAMGLVALTGHDASEAIPYFRSYAEKNPVDPRGRLAIGAAYFYAGKNEECKSEMQRLLGQAETAGGAHYFLGRLAKIEGDLEEASTQLKEAVRLLPDYADARAELGLVYTRRMEYSSALGELERALRLDANNYLANTNLLILYRRMKDEKATAQAEKVMQLQNEREQKQALLMRTIEVRPY